jgi:hypothetical protein
MSSSFDLRAVKQTEHVLRISPIGCVTDAEIRLGVADGTFVVDMEKYEIRRRHDGKILAKFADIALPEAVWSVLNEREATFGIQAITPDAPSGSERAKEFFGTH